MATASTRGAAGAEPVIVPQGTTLSNVAVDPAVTFDPALGPSGQWRVMPTPFALADNPDPIPQEGVVQAIAKESGTFDRYVWSFVGGQPKRNAWTAMGQIPAQTAESVALSKDLIARGANFVGPTICYAFMQATGLVNDHLVSCFRYRQVRTPPP